MPLRPECSDPVCLCPNEIRLIVANAVSAGVQGTGRSDAHALAVSDIRTNKGQRREMSFLLNKRRAAVAALVALLGATALFLGAGAAAAAPPNTSACRTDGFGDATVDVPGVLYATVDTFAVGNPGAQAFWVCLVPPDVGAGVDSHDPNPATPGLGYEVKACATPVGIPCGTVLGTTGAEVDAPVGTPNAPGGGDGTGGVAKEPGVCVYADGSTLTCPPPGRALAEVTVAEGDL